MEERMLNELVHISTGFRAAVDQLTTGRFSEPGENGPLQKFTEAVNAFVELAPRFMTTLAEHTSATREHSQALSENTAEMKAHGTALSAHSERLQHHTNAIYANHQGRY